MLLSTYYLGETRRGRRLFALVRGETGRKCKREECTFDMFLSDFLLGRQMLSLIRDRNWFQPLPIEEMQSRVFENDPKAG